VSRRPAEAVIIALPPTRMRGPSMTFASIASRSSTPMFQRQSASSALVTPERSTFAASEPATMAL
jgi:hypothetical protein